MGKRGGKKVRPLCANSSLLLTMSLTQGSRGGARGGGGATRTRSQWNDIAKDNEKFERYYNEPEFLPEEEREVFWATMRKDLPNSFRFTGSRGYVFMTGNLRLRTKVFPSNTDYRLTQ